MSQTEQSGPSQAADPLTAAEQREGARALSCHEVRVEGSNGFFAAQTVDISRNGALLWITDERFLTSDEASDMVRFSERVAQEFADTMRVHFEEGGVIRDAEVVRVTRKSSDDKSPVLLGCTFSAPLVDVEWQALGMRPPEPVRPATSQRVDPPVVASGPPPGIGERRAYTRTETILFAKVAGDYGSYQALVLNVSCNGALLTLDDPEFAPPDEAEQLLAFTRRLGYQFQNGLALRFREADVGVDADVVRLDERYDGGKRMIAIGVRFRRVLTEEECGALDIDPRKAEMPPPLEAITPGAAALEQLGQSRMLELIKLALGKRASDLHLKVGSPPRMRISGRLRDLSDQPPVSPEEARAMAQELMTPTLAQRLESDKDIEFALTIDGLARVRVSAFLQRGYPSLALRMIPLRIPDFGELGLPGVCRELVEKPSGLVLVTGPTGAGKSHTLAAMVDHLNRTRGGHILTLEDPIEFIYEDARAHITQREIGRDCDSFASALVRALRQDPDVMLVGEMRDPETIALALTAAETGHLVLATLHTTSAFQTPDRIIDIFPPIDQEHVRHQIADTLVGVVAQLLVPRKGGGLILAPEILVATDAVRAMIREGRTAQLRNVVQTGSKDGMQTREHALNELLAQGEINYDVAVARSHFPTQIRMPDD